VQFRWIPTHIRVPGNEAADQAAKEAAGVDPIARANAEPPSEPHSLRTLTATAKSSIRRAMRDEWDQAWEKCKHGRELFRLGVRPGKAGSLTHTSGHIEQLARQSHRCVQAILACGPTFTPSTRPIQTNVSVAKDHRRYDTSRLNAGTGWKNDIECAQVSLHAKTSNAFSVAR
jgi:hypothetical protein